VGTLVNAEGKQQDYNLKCDKEYFLIHGFSLPKLVGDAYGLLQSVSGPLLLSCVSIVLRVNESYLSETEGEPWLVTHRS
jgi:hypothetical protein